MVFGKQKVVGKGDSRRKGFWEGKGKEKAYRIIYHCRAEGLKYIGEELEDEDPEEEVGHGLGFFL